VVPRVERSDLAVAAPPHPGNSPGGDEDELRGKPEISILKKSGHLYFGATWRKPSLFSLFPALSSSWLSRQPLCPGLQFILILRVRHGF
jgi:hypothetical protein